MNQDFQPLTNTTTQSQPEKKERSSCRSSFNPQHHKTIISLLFIFLCSIISLIYYLGTFHSSSNMQITTIFLFRDAGESYGLSPLFHRLNNQHIDVQALIIPHGTNPYWQQPLPSNFILLSTILPNANSSTWFDRDISLTPHQTQTILTTYPNVQTIITGMVSNIQTSFAAAAKAKHIRVIGFDDGLSLGTWSSSTTSLPPSWSSYMLVQAGILSELWVTSTAIENKVKTSQAYKTGETINPSFQVYATGSPALLNWPSHLINQTKEINVLLNKMYLHSHQQHRPWLHIYGGYNEEHDASYGKTIELVATAIENWKNASRNAATDATPSTPSAALSAPVISFSPHPGGFPSSYEFNIFKQHHVHLIVFENVSAAVLADVANCTLSHYSTTGIQSLTVGTPHVFFSLPNIPMWDNIASAAGLIETISFSNDLQGAVERTKYTFNVSRLSKAGIPTNAVERMMKRYYGDVNRSML